MDMNHGNDCGHSDEEHRKMAEEIQKGLREAEEHADEAAEILAKAMANGDATQTYFNNHPAFKVSMMMLTKLVQQSGSILPQQLPLVVEVVKLAVAVTLVNEGKLTSVSSTGSEVPDIFKDLDIPGLDTL